MQIDASGVVVSEPFEIVELDDAALLGVEPTNTCCPINMDCSCWPNWLFGCGGGCGDEE